jgi:ABC-type lipoprotein release transport system permease subunit
MMKEIQLIPGVASVAPYIDQQIIIVRGSKVMGAELRGIIPEEEKNISTIENDVLKGNLDSLTTDQIFLGWRLAKELEATMGDRVQLVTAYGTRSFKVTGLMKSGLYQQDMTRVLINLQTAQDLLKMSNEVTGISVSIYDIYQAPEISRAITAVTSLKTRNWMEDNEIILQQIQNFKVIFGFISFMIIFSAASSITSVLIMVVASKSKEIGILKSMGMTAASIIKMFLLQAMFLSLLGAIVGIFGGMGIIAIYNATPMAKGETFIGIAREPAHISIEYTFRAIFYAMLSSFLASLIPAWQAGRLDPVKNINQ